jgi:hypothetical protein
MFFSPGLDGDAFRPSGAEPLRTGKTTIFFIGKSAFVCPLMLIYPLTVMENHHLVKAVNQL